jgi:Xaa-Pro aminopeptidase
VTLPRALPGELFPYSQRLKNLRAALKKTGLPALLITGRENITYLSGFRGTAAVLLITPKTSLLFSDFRYRLQASEQAPHFQFREVARGLLMGVSDYLNKTKLPRIGFESANLTVAQFSKIKQGSVLTWRASEGLVENLREVKDAEEIKQIARAAKITDQVLAYMLSRLKPGMTESALARAGESFALQAGAKGAAFDFIIASGPHAALPHAEVGPRKLRRGDLIVFDLGVKLPGGYCSDLTRTVALGKAYPWQQKIYASVYAAQSKALDALRPGRSGEVIDAAAREIIDTAGYGEYFGHALGHGVGLEVHEAPRLAAGQKQILAPGMVVTVEPGVYLPQRGGVRIEDLVVVTATGYRLLSHAPKPAELPII